MTGARPSALRLRLVLYTDASPVRGWLEAPGRELTFTGEVELLMAVEQALATAHSTDERSDLM